MNATDWAALFVSIISIAGSFAIAVRFLVKHYLSELKPNSGSSLKDSVTRLEERVDQIMLLLIEQGKPKTRKKSSDDV